MVWSVTWDDGFVVGGDENRRLTPNFRLKEFKNAAGTVRIHREVVSALQMLRERFGRTISIRDTDADGLGATVTADSITELLSATDRVQSHHLFAEVTRVGDAIHVRIPDPQHLPPIDLGQALESAFSVTAGFETSGDRFQQITGNFDGAGLSFGPAQWNFKSGTLVPLFCSFAERDPSALQACFRDPVDYEDWRKVLRLPAAEQIQWANSISTGRNNQEVVEPWKSYFQAVGRVPKFRAAMVEMALRMYGAKLLEGVKFLEGLVPGVEIDHLRCVCSLYDLMIQQGSLDKARSEIEQRVRQEHPRDQFALVRIAVEERGRKAGAEWRADCVSRRVGILQGVPETVDGHQRANLNFFLLRDVRIRGARELLAADVGAVLAQVADAVATGGTLLA
jgi:hypothetical protein